ncbi:DUF1766-domain-containing protein, partial [Saccharata proteae CBS 121410]
LFTSRWSDMTGLVKRNDSKNPATTCKGVTNSGRPCRRDIAAARASKAGVLAVAAVDDGEGAAAFFCWQHKDQAEQLKQAQPALNSGGRQDETRIYPLQQKSSIDTLMGRLGVLDEEEDEGKKRRRMRTSKQNAAGGHHMQRPPTWNQVQGPLMSVPSDVMASNAPYARPTSRPSSKQKHRGFWASLCCGAADEDEDYYESNNRPSSSSPTGRNLSFIPAELSPQTASSLVAELSKPISAHDEPGFIYIFWLTESVSPSQTRPSERDASSLLSPPNTPKNRRSSSNSNTNKSPAPDPDALLRQHSVRVGSSATRSRGLDTTASESQGKRHILLKIGRANNVHRRMNEWKHQCGYAPTLVRFYPYTNSPTKSSPDSSTAVKRIPYAHKVERLVHIELGSQRVLRECEHCGRQHREWFEVEATREGVRGVDEVVRRWVRWAEGV